MDTLTVKEEYTLYSSNSTFYNAKPNAYMT